MNDELVFDIAENEQGELVYVDDVPRGKKCGCHCPNCHEDLAARHGNLRAHHFYHTSDKRGANLKICYAVTLYKLAEQIIKKEKRIYAPSYYGIFKGKELKFVDVKVDSSFEREDKQPDVIAATEDGKQYLIEFVFAYKVQHKKAIDYKNLNCIEIDLSNQVLNRESLNSFLLGSDKDRRWLNNEEFFERIEETYKAKNKNVKVVSVSDCQRCDLLSMCCAVRDSFNNHIRIENNGEFFFICKTDVFNQLKRKIEEGKKLKELQRAKQQENRIEREKYITDYQVSQITQPIIYSRSEDSISSSENSHAIPEVQTKKTEFDENIAKILEYVNRPDFNFQEECDFLKWIKNLRVEDRHNGLNMSKREECINCQHHVVKLDGRWHICNWVKKESN